MPLTGASSGAISGVVFDLDGVLIDSEGRWDEVRRGLASAAGRPWPADATTAMQGMSTSEWSAYLTGTVGIGGSAAAVAQEVISQMAARYRGSLPLIPGAVEVVRRLGARWPLGLASSSPRQLIDTVLAAADLTSQFEVTLSTEQVSAGKPSPEVYLAVASRMGLDPRLTVAIEDSSNGLRSASAAGMRVLAVPHAGFPPAAAAVALADAVIDQLDDITVELIESLARS
jgi:HAD superfamily hydrolase (TIGR01509 family)